MQVQRLVRLMNIISDMKHNPRSNPDALCARFAISRRQFYKDRDTLEAMGFNFHFSRRRNRLVLDREPIIGSFKLDELMALMLAGQSLIFKDDLNQVLTAFAGIRRMLDSLPAQEKKYFSNAFDQLLLEEGLGCSQAMLDEISACLLEERRIVVLLKKEEAPLMLDPRELALFKGTLYLISGNLDSNHPASSHITTGQTYKNVLNLRLVRKIVPTPFFSPA